MTNFTLRMLYYILYYIILYYIILYYIILCYVMLCYIILLSEYNKITFVNLSRRSVGTIGASSESFVKLLKSLHFNDNSQKHILSQLINIITTLRFLINGGHNNRGVGKFSKIKISKKHNSIVDIFQEILHLNDRGLCPYEGLSAFGTLTRFSVYFKSYFISLTLKNSDKTEMQIYLVHFNILNISLCFLY